MSSIPKPKAVRTPKKRTGDADLDKSEHQQLLDWLWTNLDRVIPLWISTKQEFVDDEVRNAARTYIGEVQETLKAYRKCAETADDQEHIPALKLAIQRIEKHLSDVRTSIPPLPHDANVSYVLDKHYQQEITETKSDRSGNFRDEVVGYIDIEADVSLFSSCRLSGCPIENSSHSIFAFHRSKPSAEQYSKQKVKPMEWGVSRRTKRVWFDVRSTLPPAGILIRELRLLQELAGEGVIIALVTSCIPGQLGDLLRHEGFWSISQSDMSKLIAEQN